jgi:hypothetical protein
MTFKSFEIPPVSCLVELEVQGPIMLRPQDGERDERIAQLVQRAPGAALCEVRDARGRGEGHRIFRNGLRGPVAQWQRRRS